MLLTHLLENVEYTPQQMAEHILRDCSQFLQDSQGEPLYRGMTRIDRTKGHYLIPLKDRMPTDSSPKLSQLLDSELEDMAGFKPRANGTFATGNAQTAQTYGVVYRIFPKDGYKFIWSPKIGDAYGFFQLQYGQRFVRELIDATEAAMPSDWSLDEDNLSSDEFETNLIAFNKKFLEMHKHVLYKTGRSSTIADAIEKGNEIMLGCEGYYAIPIDHQFGRDVSNHLIELTL